MVGAGEAAGRRIVCSVVPGLRVARTGVLPRDGFEPPTQGFSVPRSTD